MVCKINIWNASTQGRLEPPTFWFKPNALTIELSGTNISYLIFWNTGSSGIDRLVCNVNIWNVNCVQATAFIFDSRTAVLVKGSGFLRQRMSQPEGDSYPPTFGFMPNALTIWAIGPDISYHMFWNTVFGGIDIDSVQYTHKTPHSSPPWVCSLCDSKWKLATELHCILKRFWKSHKEGNQSKGIFSTTI